MHYLYVLFLILVLSTPARAHEPAPPPTSVPATDSCRAADKWIAFDKGLHFGGGFVISAAVTAKTEDPWKGFWVGAGAGVLKEALDSKTGGCVSGKDFVVTVLGAAAGASFTNWNIQRQRGTGNTLVTYSWRLP